MSQNIIKIKYYLYKIIKKIFKKNNKDKQGYIY